jgi:hypothetical protein
VRDGRRVVERRIGHRFGQDLVPPSELRQRQQWNRLEELDGGELLDLLDPYVGRHLARGLDRDGAASLHARRRPQEVNVVRVVHRRVEPLGVALRDVRLIDSGGPHVRFRRVVIPADTPVRVRGHVHQVTGSGDEVRQRVGGLFRASRIRRCLDRVDVEVQRKWVPG